MEGVSSLSEILSGFSDFVDVTLSCVSDMVDTMTSHPLLMLGLFAWLFMIGVGIFSKLVRGA